MNCWRPHIRLDPSAMVILVDRDGTHGAIPSGYAFCGTGYESAIYAGSACDPEWLESVRHRLRDPTGLPLPPSKSKDDDSTSLDEAL